VTDLLAAGHELDLLVGEKVLGWEWIQAPQWDAKGPLPEQGKVLVTPGFRAGDPHGYQWPNVGVIAPHAFTRPWSTRQEDGHAVVAALVARRVEVQILFRPGPRGHTSELATVHVNISPLDSPAIRPVWAESHSFPHAVCLAAVAWAEARGRR